MAKPPLNKPSAVAASVGHRLLRTPLSLASRFQTAFAILTVALATTLFLPFRGVLDKGHWGVGYLGLVVGVAAAGGSRAAAVAAISAFACWNYFFIPPYYTLVVHERQDLFTLLIFLIVSIAVGLLTGQSRNRERQALRREREATLLNRLSGEILATESEQAMASTVLETVRGAVSADEVAVFIAGTQDRLEATWDPKPTEWRAEVVARVESLLRSDIDPVILEDESRDEIVFLPLQTKDAVLGVLYAGNTTSHRPYGAEDRRLLASVANLLSAFVQQTRLRRQASAATALKEADRLKSTFISSVSHELKTPLASLMASVTGLLQRGDATGLEVHAELEAAVIDLRRLESSIGDLLDIARLEGAAWRFQPDLYEIGEVIGSVRAQLPAEARRRVELAVDAGIPPIMMDFRQMVRALRNVVENALRYSPADSAVCVGARILGDGLIVWVQDQGPGISAEEKNRVFDKFYIGHEAHASPGSTGLGLAIVKEIVDGHGGRVWVDAAEPTGACFTLSIPLRARLAKDEAS